MNKHILSYSEKVNESIGNGSVILIKGKPMKDGRYLYVTTIKGFVEIRPGIKMVFLGDQLYRVIHKGNGKFSGRKVGYNGEEGLKGVFNMKTPNRPSLVLNHNKTPFHWITLKYNDIGSALRSIGSNLFSHELILESNDELDFSKIADDANALVLNEVLKIGLGQPSKLRVLKLDDDEYSNALGNLEDIEDEEDVVSEPEYVVNIYVVGSSKDFPKEYYKYYDAIGLFDSDEEDEIFNILDKEDRETLGIKPATGAEVSIMYKSTVELEHEFDPGDWETPGYLRIHIGSSENEINFDEIYVDGGSCDKNKSYKLLTEYSEHIRYTDIDEIISEFEKAVKPN